LYEERSQRCCQKGDRRHLTTGNFWICDIVLIGFACGYSDRPIGSRRTCIWSGQKIRLQRDRPLPVQPQSERVFSTFSSSKSDRQPKPNECDRFLAIQPKIGTLLSHLIQGKSIASPNWFVIGFPNINPTYSTGRRWFSPRSR
jgi:hypothetical protein